MCDVKKQLHTRLVYLEARLGGGRSKADQRKNKRENDKRWKEVLVSLQKKDKEEEQGIE